MLERTAASRTDVLDPVPPAPRDGRQPRSTAAAAAAAAAVALAWVAILATMVVALHRGGGAPTSQVLAYLAAWILGCTFPGVLVWRALAGHSTIVRELGF